MADSDAPILPLPPEVAKQVQSSVRITNLNEVVMELMKNALDADAGSITIIVDYRRGGCVVEDDGYGLPTAEFQASSGLCRAHNTSKAGRQSVSSCKGLFLSALATMSLLTISSRHRGHSQTNTAIFHGSKAISRLLPAPTHQEIQGSHGTRVTVNNLFGNMPVRVKHRASTLQRPEDVDKEWEGLKRIIVALALSNARLQKLRLSHSDRTHALHLRIPSIPTDAPQPETIQSGILRLQAIFAQSGLVPSAGNNEWVHMSASTLEVSVNAYVALSSSPTKLNQFISLGVNPILNAHSNANVLYNKINQVFTASDFGSNEIPSENNRDFIVPESRGSKLKGVVRGAKRWPMFYLRIDVKNSLETLADDETVVESDSTFQHIIEVLHAMFYQFLQQHHYRPRKRRKVIGETPSTSHSRDASAIPSGDSNQRARDTRSISSVRRAPTSGFSEGFDSSVRLPAPPRKQSHYFNNFTGWSRVKSGDKKAIDDLLSCRPKENGCLRTAASPSGVNWPSNVSSQIEDQTLDGTNQDRHMGPEATDGLIRWVDPSTNSVVLVNSRTGQCSAGQPEHDRPNTSIGIVRPRSTVSPRSVYDKESIKRPQSAPAREESLWYENLVNNWANPVFSRLEQPITSIDNDAVSGHYFTRNALQGSRNRNWDFVGGTEISNKSRGKLSRKGLAEARVIAQVDRKFILVRMATAEGRGSAGGKADKMLVLIDQHAADERCRLEHLLVDMFTIEEEPANVSIRTHQLPASVQYPIQDDEVAPFQTYSRYFESWGCHYKVDQMLVDTTRQPTIIIEALPLVIVERCRLEPKLFVDLLRKEIWSRAGERVPSSRVSTMSPMTTTVGQPGDAHTHFPWLHWIAGCPEGITELISSRACRSSIMFNDPLSMKECEYLISRLSHCAFPFQCAHGRPTMIPIVVDEGHYQPPPLPSLSSSFPFSEDENANNNYYLQEQKQEPGFFEAFKKWKRS